MSCFRINVDGVPMIVCKPRGKRARCSVSVCRKKAEYLCDAPTGRGGGVCSQPMCGTHRKHMGDQPGVFASNSVDFCPACERKGWQLSLPL